MGKAQTMAGPMQGGGAKGHDLSIKINFFRTYRLALETLP